MNDVGEVVASARRPQDAFARPRALPNSRDASDEQFSHSVKRLVAERCCARAPTHDRLIR
jgi:hypothetical protein